jgi:Fe-S oxidoreductase
LLRTGFDATDLIEHNIEQIERTGAHTVIVSCAGCYSTLKNDYPGDLNVVHITEFLEKHLKELDLKPLDINVTYHDPCHLGRSSGIYDPPRNIINSICLLKEMDSNRENAKCCGGGGGVRKSYPDLSGSIAGKRTAQFPPEIDALITCCPLCRSNLEKETEKKVMDIVDLLILSMRESL